MPLANQADTQAKPNTTTPWGTSPPRSEVRGHKAGKRPAGPRVVAAARVADFALVGLLFSAIPLITRASPIPRLWWIPAWIALALLYRTACRVIVKKTVGELFWQLFPNPSYVRYRGRPWSFPRTGSWVDRTQRLALDFWDFLWETPPAQLKNAPSLLQYGKPDPLVLLLGGCLTIAAIALSGWVSYLGIFSVPLWHRAETIEYDAYFPPQGTENEWVAVPFFYGLGAWPSTYEGRPVWHTFPYEKGPPRRFAGHITAHWDEFHTTVTFEGPRTPREGFSRSRIERCVKSFSPFKRPFGCLLAREAILSRHIDEMRRQLGSLGREPSSSSASLSLDWSLDWFLVRNPALPAEEQAQGIRLSASNTLYTQIRYIMITPKGTHQAFTLNFSNKDGDKDGHKARELFERAIRSLRISDDLGQGIAWIDRRLESTRLDGLDSLKNPVTRLRTLTRIQTLLLSKISVDPKTFDSYFHLAGVSLSLAQLASRELARPSTSPPTPGLFEALSASKGLIESAYRYAEDVAPTEPRTPKMREFALHAKKLGTGF